MSIRQLIGDARVQLASLPAESVQAVITSPPYYGLRDYQTDPLVWGGDPEHMQHEWGVAIRSPWANDVPGPSTNHPKNSAASHWTPKVSGQFCACGAWLGSLGLEPTPDLYLEHLVEVFREVRRVLRPDGVCWVNLGDSYAGGGGYSPGSPSNVRRQERLAGGDDRDEAFVVRGEHNYLARQKPSRRHEGVKSKDLLMMPARLAMALRDDGWYLRSQIPWLKRNAMPESVRDRPATAVEYVYLLSKSNRCYWDGPAVQQPVEPRSAWSIRSDKQGVTGMEAMDTSNGRRYTGFNARWNAGIEGGTNPAGRNRRNSDWFFESWQGLLLDEQGDPLAFIVNPVGFSGAHFAVMPPKLVEPMVKASTSDKGQCPECGAPWVRVTEKESRQEQKSWSGAGRENGCIAGGGHFGRTGEFSSEVTTLGWRPSCAHDADPVPQTVLDPFSGAGTVSLVADRLGRNAIGIDLKADYADMAADRLTGDAPLFVELSA